MVSFERDFNWAILHPAPVIPSTTSRLRAPDNKVNRVLDISASDSPCTVCLLAGSGLCNADTYTTSVCQPCLCSVWCIQQILSLVERCALFSTVDAGACSVSLPALHEVVLTCLDSDLVRPQLLQ